jgi:protein-tyrosine phosphatase
VILLGLLTAACWGDNFQTIVPGTVYGSGQPDAGSLQLWVARYHLHSVVNLRGANAAESWYQEERAAARKQRLSWYDLPIESQVLPKSEEVKGLVSVLDTCPKPALIHCYSGIDRTGMAAVISVLLLDDDGSPRSALAQLSWWHGHFPGRRSVGVKWTFVDRYESWLKDNGWQHNPARFRDWALTAYQSDPANPNNSKGRKKP